MSICSLFTTNTEPANQTNIPATDSTSPLTQVSATAPQTTGDAITEVILISFVDAEPLIHKIGEN